MSVASCKTCKYFVRSDDENQPSECHRNPPSLHLIRLDQKSCLTGQVQSVMQTHGLWPPVHEDAYCGEYFSFQPQQSDY